MSTTASVTNCDECPNFVKGTTPDGNRAIGSCREVEQVIFIGGSISTFNHLTEIASSCPSAGEPTTKEWLGDSYPIIKHEQLIPRFGKADKLSSCTSCEHHKRITLGSYETDVCGATGVIIDNCYTACTGCHYAVEGISDPTSFTLNDIIFNPSKIVSDEAVAVKVEAKAATKREAVVSFDPTTYVSDMQVTEEYKGIVNSWRLVEVGEGSKRKGVYVPIFDPELFTEGEREMIPSFGDDNHPELYFDGSSIQENFVIACWMKGKTLCLIGEPGSGKTEGARRMAYLLQLPFTHLQIDEGTMPEDLIGRAGFKEGATYFNWGRLPRAAERPAILLSDEVNTGQDAILQAYRSFTSEAGQIFLEGEETHERRVVTKHDYCFHMMALNPAYDARNLGVRELADADISRLTHLYVHEPEDRVIKDIIIAKTDSDGTQVTAEELEGMMKVRNDLKEMSRNGSLPYSWSIRQDVKVAELLEFYSPQTAYKRALLDYCAPETAEMAMKSVTSVFGFA